MHIRQCFTYVPASLAPPPTSPSRTQAAEARRSPRSPAAPPCDGGRHVLPCGAPASTAAGTSFQSRQTITDTLSKRAQTTIMHSRAYGYLSTIVWNPRVHAYDSGWWRGGRRVLEEVQGSLCRRTLLWTQAVFFASQRRDRHACLSLHEKTPENVLQFDPKMWYICLSIFSVSVIFLRPLSRLSKRGRRDKVCSAARPRQTPSANLATSASTDCRNPNAAVSLLRGMVTFPL